MHQILTAPFLSLSVGIAFWPNASVIVRIFWCASLRWLASDLFCIILYGDVIFLMSPQFISFHLNLSFVVFPSGIHIFWSVFFHVFTFILLLSHFLANSLTVTQELRVLVGLKRAQVLEDFIAGVCRPR